MSQTKTVTLQIDAKEALKRLDAVEKELGEISKTSKKTESALGKMAKGFKGVGLAMKAAGFGLVMKLVDNVTDALMKNQAVADTVETVFNSIGLVFKMVSDTLISVYNQVSANSENFDALGRILKNVMTIALKPMELAFQGLKLGIQKLALAWHKSPLGSGDVTKIKELQAGVDGSKEKIKELKDELINAGTNIVNDFAEAAGEITNIATVAVDEFKNTFEGVTVNSIIEQGKAITQTKKNYALLALEQQRLIEQYDREAEVLRQQRDDIRLTVDERIAANDELAGVLEKQTDAEKAAVQAQIDSLKELNQLEGETPERMQELFSLKTEMLAIDAKIAGFQSEQKTNEAALQDERVSNMQELTAIGQTEIEKQRSAIEIEAENRRTLAMRTISDAQLLQETLVAIEKDTAAQLKAIDDKEASDSLKIQKAKIQAEKELRISAAKDILSSVAQLAGEGTATAKAAALAGILIDTAKGISGAISAGAGLIFPANLGAIATGVASVLAGVANARAVLKKVPGGGGGGGNPSVSVTGGSGSESPSPAPSGIGALVPNVEGIGGGDEDIASQPVQAYVVENDISNQQALQEELEVQSTL